MHSPGVNRSDTALVRDCIKGDPKAWEALIDKYKNLIFSVPIKQGFSQEEATDIFQEVCLDLVAQLPRLREPRALPKWLIQVTAHKCFHARRAAARLVQEDDSDSKHTPVDEASLPDELVEEVQREQILRDAVAALPDRCRRLIEMLFFEKTVLPYKEIASGLGLATGSIGFIRGRCLERLKKLLEEGGF